jgi:hypothetical protein
MRSLRIDVDVSEYSSKVFVSRYVESVDMPTAYIGETIAHKSQ